MDKKKKRYVYLVYEEWHGFVGVYGHEAIAIGRIHEIAKQVPFDTDTPYDYFSEERVGWEGIAWYVREEVRE